MTTHQAPAATAPAISDATDPAATARHAAASLTRRTGVPAYDVAIVLGSGWAPAADALGPAAEFDVTELPGFTAPVVAGQLGRLRSARVGGKQVLIFLGRTHLYERRGVEQVVHGVRTAVAAGAGVVILTNAAGGIRADLRPGQPVAISDHLNLTACSPLAGGDFLDLTDVYSPRLRGVAGEIDPTLVEGVYAAMPGPHFETPAEIRMLRGMGADLVGMSTVLEAIAARAEGAEVFGLSLVTNLAAGITGAPLDHEDVLATGRAAAERIGSLLAGLVAAL